MDTTGFPLADTKVKVINDEPEASKQEASGASEPTAKPEPTTEPDGKYALVDDSQMTLDALFLEGRLTGTLNLGRVTATYQSISAEESLAVEELIDLGQNRTPKFILSTVSLGHLKYALVAYNGKRLPEDPETRDKIIKSRPAFEVNMIIDGYQVFADMCEKVIREGDLENF
jgi:hypothetical protein